MKTLIIYYSRTNHTKTIAEKLANALSADIEKIQEVKSREGIIGWIMAGKDATLKKLTNIKGSIKNPAHYDLVIIGTPIWAFTMTPAVRSWLTKFADQLNQVAFFATMSGSGDKSAFKQMEEICHRSPIATTSFIDKKIDKGLEADKLQAFLEKLQSDVITVIPESAKRLSGTSARLP